MIEKMKKLSLFIYHSSKDRFLENLQNLGVVHLEADKSIQNDEILTLKNLGVKIEKIIKFLNTLENKSEDVKQIEYNDSIENLLKEIEEKQIKLNEMIARYENIKKEIDLLKIWGNFDPELIQKINKETGYKIKFYSTISKNYYKIKNKDIIYEKIGEFKSRIYFMVLYKEEIEIAEILELGIEEKIPLKSLNSLEIEKEILNEKINKEKNSFTQYLKYLKYFENNKLILEDRIDYNIANLNLIPEADNKVLLINGWIPKRNLESVIKFLNNEDVAFLIENPNKNEDIPILLKNNKIVKLFEPITKMHSLPSYIELDPTPFFAPFFSAFFGLCLADIGYGLILFFIVIATLILGKNKKLKPILFLGLILSIMTIISGVILDSLFGFKFTELKILPESFKKFVIFGNIQDQMTFALLLGVVQILFGFILQIVNKVKTKGFLAALQPLGTMFLITGGVFYLVGFFINGDFNIGPIPIKKLILSIPYIYNITIVLLITGAILVLLFNNIGKSIFIRPLIGLWEIYGIITGIPGDILSYIRLFALGLAGALLGNAFNQIAFIVKDNAPPIINYLGMLLILIGGHTINLALSALSAFVHPLRLILLEFYKAVGFTGGGKPFVPFKNRFVLNTKCQEIENGKLA